MKRVLVLCIALCLCPSAVPEPFPAEFLPDGPRPRLWLTPDRLEALGAGRTLESPEWLVFRDYVEQSMTEIPWNGAQRVMAAMALMHRLTGEQRYADRAMAVLDGIPDRPENENDAGHGNYGFMGLVFDWLYDNPAMTPERKGAYVDKMVRWSDFVWTDSSYNAEGVWASSRDSDHVTMTGAAHLMLGCAVYGETDRARDLLDRGWWMWSRGAGLEVGDEGYEEGNVAQPVRQWVRNALGGMYYTGWSYFWGTDSAGLTHYWITLKTACGYDVAKQEPGFETFWPNVIRTTLDLTDPPRRKIHHTGDWEDENWIEPQAWFYSLMARASYFAGDDGDPLWASYGRGYARQFESQHDDEFVEFFFSDARAPETDPYEAGLPTVRFADGADWLFFRGGWGTTANWGMFSGQGAEPVDHQNSDTGHFVLWREDDFLTKGCRVYGSPDNGVLYNTLSIQNGLPNGSARMGGNDGKASIARHRISNGPEPFAYAMMDSGGQWNENRLLYNPVRRVLTYRRHFFWSGETAAVLDRLRTADAGWCVYRLRALTEPVAGGKVIRQISPNGRHALIHTTLAPENVEFEVLDETAAWEGVYPDWEVPLDERRWQTLIRPPESDRVNLLHAIQTGPAGLVESDAKPIAGEGILGARTGGWALVFADGESLRSGYAYTLGTASGRVRHLAADLRPGTYQVSVNGERVTRPTVLENDNTAYFETPPSDGPLTVEIAEASGVGDWAVR